MSAEMRSAFAQQRVGMSGLRDDMIKVQYGYFKMAQGAKDYQGTNAEFMAGIEEMGKRNKKINDNDGVQRYAEDELLQLGWNHARPLDASVQIAGQLHTNGKSALHG